MAQVKLLKIGSDGVPTEMNTTSDDITLNSYTVQGGGPVLSGSGLNMSNQDISAIKNLIVTDPSVDTINQTAGNLVIDNIMAKERENTMTTAGGVAFPVITDVASQVDALRIPALAGIPSATPSNGGSGHLLFDSVDKDTYIWTGSSWDNLNTTKALDDPDYVAGENLSANNAVYISGASAVSIADAPTIAKSGVLGFAISAASSAAAVTVRKSGPLSGFSSLTPGARQYLGTAGAITATLPTASGSTVVQVGYAKSATILDIQILQLGRRA